LAQAPGNDIRIVANVRGLPCGIFCRLPIRIIRATFDIIDGLAIEFKRTTKLNQRSYVAEPGENAVAGRVNRTYMPRAKCGERSTCWSLDIDHPTAGAVQPAAAVQRVGPTRQTQTR